MAKWGEGDPRWIVEDRPDATNVNNWHWTEKNASPWSKDKLKALFTDLVLAEPGIGSVTITEVTNIDGEASANNRKAKLIFFYEWEIKMNWKGKLQNSDNEVTGKIEIPNLSEENKPEDVDITVSVSNNSAEGDILKEMIRLKGVKKLREKVSEYVKDLREEFSVGMVLPRKDEGESKSISVSLKHNTKSEKGRVSSSDGYSSDSSQKVVSGVQISTTRLKLKQTFKCTAEELYNALTIVEMVQAFTQGPCKLELRKGGKFELFGGNITGEFLELVPGKCIKQSWRFKSWPEGHYSQVSLGIEQKEDSTEIIMTQTGIPSSHLDQTRDGWNHYYFESMKKTFGFGALLI